MLRLEVGLINYIIRNLSRAAVVVSCSKMKQTSNCTISNQTRSSWSKTILSRQSKKSTTTIPPLQNNLMNTA